MVIIKSYKRQILACINLITSVFDLLQFRSFSKLCLHTFIEWPFGIQLNWTYLKRTFYFFGAENKNQHAESFKTNEISKKRLEYSCLTFLFSQFRLLRVKFLKEFFYHLKNINALSQGRIYDFLEGGGGFSKNFRKFWRPFSFRSTKMIFRALPKHCFFPYFGLNFQRRR